MNINIDDIFNGHIISVSREGVDYKIGIIAGGFRRIIIHDFRDGNCIFVPEDETTNFLKQGDVYKGYYIKDTYQTRKLLGYVSDKVKPKLNCTDNNSCNIDCEARIITENDVHTGRVSSVTVNGTVYHVCKVHEPYNTNTYRIIMTEGNGNCCYVPCDRTDKFLVGIDDGKYAVGHVDITDLNSEDRNSFMWKFNNGKIDHVIVDGVKYAVAKIHEDNMYTKGHNYRIVLNVNKGNGVYDTYISFRDTLNFIQNGYSIDSCYKRVGSIVEYVKPITVVPMVDTYVPFTTHEECIAQVGKVVRYKYDKCGWMILKYDCNITKQYFFIGLGTSCCEDIHAFTALEFIDGTPFGKKV